MVQAMLLVAHCRQGNLMSVPVMVHDTQALPVPFFTDFRPDLRPLDSRIVIAMDEETGKLLVLRRLAVQAADTCKGRVDVYNFPVRIKDHHAFEGMIEYRGSYM